MSKKQSLSQSIDRSTGRPVELSQVDEVMRAERQRFMNVLETLPAYLVLLTPDHHVAFANRFFRERFGESQGRRCFEYLFGRTEPCEPCETYKVLENNAPRRWEWTGPDGRLYDIYDFPFTDTDGTPLIMEMGLDITERKRTEEALREANETLEQRVVERTAAVQEVNEQLQAQSEELRVTNEELQSQAEELRAANEELQAQQEELQAQTEELRAGEESLRESEQRYRSLFENMLDGYAYCQMLYDSQGRPTDFVYLRVNDAFTRLTGLQNVVGRKVTELIPTIRASHPELLETYGRVALTGQPERFEIEFKPLERWFSISVYSARPGYFTAVFDNITERKRAEESKAQLAAIVRFSDDAIISKDLDGVIRTWNVGAERLLGYRAEEIIGEPIARLLPPERREEEDEILGRLRRGEYIEHFETVRVAKDGRRVDVSATLSPLRSADGALIGASKILRDITQRKRAEAALRQANEQLQQQAQELQTQAEELQMQTEELTTANEELRTSELALRESEERFRTMADAIPQLAWIAHADGYIYWYNQRWYEYTGTTPAQMEGWGWQSVHDPQKLPQVLEQWKSSIATGQPFDMVFPLRGADGILRPFLTRVMPLKDEQGCVRQWFGTNTDVSEQKRAEEALRESEERFRVLTANLSSGVALIDEDGKFALYNPAFLRMFGLAENSSIRNINDQDWGTWQVFEPDGTLLHVDDHPVRKAALTGQAVKNKLVGVRLPAGGDLTWMLISAEPIPRADGRRAIICTYHDVTEQKRMEETLREWNATLESKVAERTTELVQAGEKVRAERQRFLDMLDTLPVIIDIIRPDHRIEWTNRAYREALGDNQGHLCYASQFGSDTPCAECQAFIPLQTGRPQHWEWTLPSGRTFDIYDFPFADADGAPVILEMDIDITERKQAEAKLREWNETLEQRVAERTTALQELNATLESKVAQRTAQLESRARQLQKLTLELSQTEDRERKRMADILHDDLQQQLAAAKFHLSLLNHRVKHDPQQQAVVARVDQMLREAVEKSRSLSHDLSPAVLYQGDLGQTFEWLARQMQTQHGLVVTVSSPREIHLQTDALKAFLYKAGQELLFNVVKHGRVKEAAIRLRRWGRYVALSVTDRGRGFDPQQLKQATGFGLFGIRERVELLGGHMTIKSVEGKGSTFRVVVPDEAGPGTAVKARRRLVPTSAEAPRPDESAPMTRGHRLRVLLADDHEIVRQGLKAILGDEPDVEVVGEAANGREAVDLAGRLEPDVVIMDVSMPLISGEQATRQVKTLLPGIRVIALSMYNEPETLEQMYRAGAEGYVLKTAPTHELLAAIRGRA